jgi:hypothetical protein
MRSEWQRTSTGTRYYLPWNWVDASRLNNYNCVITINRNTLANYFCNQLASYYVPSKYCILPSFRPPSTVVLSTYLSQDAVQITDEEEKLGIPEDKRGCNVQVRAHS